MASRESSHATGSQTHCNGRSESYGQGINSFYCMVDTHLVPGVVEGNKHKKSYVISLAIIFYLECSGKLCFIIAHVMQWHHD